MFIQLTRTDGAPVWLNSCFIVTIEPARGGGSIVVPIGDGLDYEVRERPEKVLAMLEGAPAPSVVPVPPPKTLAPRPDDVSPETDPRDCDCVTEPAVKPAKKAAKPKPAKKASAAAPADVPAADAESAKAPVAADAEPVAAPKKKRASAGKKKTDPPPREDFGDTVARLRALKCRTVKRMCNAMKSSCGIEDPAEAEKVLSAMADAGYISVDSDGHVNWTGQAV